jgi:lysophospholipase L1-like esterase
MQQFLMLPILQILLSGCAIVAAIFSKLPWLAVAAMALLAGESFSVARRNVFCPRGWWLCWLGTLTGVVTLFVTDFHNLGAAISGLLNGAAILLAGSRLEPQFRNRWRMPGLVWGFHGAITWLAWAYGQNLEPMFYAGLGIALGLLVLCKWWFRLPAAGVLAANTLLVLLVGLPVVDAMMRPRQHLLAHPDPAGKYYSYEVAMKDPGGFVSWNRYATAELRQLNARFYAPDTAGVLPYRLRPGASGPLFNSAVAINSMGFRGREIPREKGNAYRIVALGESTTFGDTLNPGDQPWPELLEEMIAARLKPSRPVEVINAGTPGYTIKENLYRLWTEILALKPDLIISYHGYNGFPLISSALPPVLARDTPVYHERPLKLLADFEFGLRVAWFRHRQASAATGQPASVNPLDTEYARAYRELIRLAETNHVRLVLANYSMAVNEASDPRVIEFYRRTCPDVYAQMQVNVLHSQIVKTLAGQNPGVGFVDTHPGLDGRHDKFIDVVHFAREGEEQMAATIFAGITNVLVKDLAALPRAD